LNCCFHLSQDVNTGEQVAWMIRSTLWQNKFKQTSRAPWRLVRFSWWESHVDVVANLVQHDVELKL
jgi:hypothetical protein